MTHVTAEAISVEGGDLLARASVPPPAVPHIVGYASAGTVSEVAADVEGLAVGDRVVALNNAGFAKMQAGDYAGALPLLEQAASKLDGTGRLDEAYAKYNLAYTRFQLGNCDGVLDLLDQAEAIEGQKSAIDQLRAQAQQDC